MSIFETAYKAPTDGKAAISLNYNSNLAAPGNSPVYNSYTLSKSSTNFITINIPLTNIETKEQLTTLTENNLFYFHTEDAREVSGYNRCDRMINSNRSSKVRNSDKYINARKLDLLTNKDDKKKSCLANCVGFAFGRVNEMWWNNIKSGNIIQDESKTEYIIPSANNKVIIGKIKIPELLEEKGATQMLNENAASWWNSWPINRSGWYKSKLTPKFNTLYEPFLNESGKDGGNPFRGPVVGAVMCWRVLNDVKGHVAVIESVHNYGTDDEFVVISESACSAQGAEYIIRTRKLAKYDSYATKTDKPYSYINDSVFIFQGFLYSPLCQVYELSNLSSSGSINFVYTPTSSGISEEDAARYKEIAAAIKGSKVKPELAIGDTVAIEWIGYSNADGNQRRVNVIGSENARISNIMSGKNYPYEVSISNNIVGYFDRSALVKKDE